MEAILNSRNTNRIGETTMSDEELDAIRRRKLAYQQRASDEQRQTYRKGTTRRKKRYSNKYSTGMPAAHELKMVKKEFTEQLEMQLIQLAQMGKAPIPMSDTQLKQILIQLQSRKRETKITRI
jgi:programmed cell death protein 5